MDIADEIGEIINCSCEIATRNEAFNGYICSKEANKKFLALKSFKKLDKKDKRMPRIKSFLIRECDCILVAFDECQTKLVLFQDRDKFEETIKGIEKSTGTEILEKQPDQ